MDKVVIIKATVIKVIEIISEIIRNVFEKLGNIEDNLNELGGFFV
jgi:hypothetical protein